MYVQLLFLCATSNFLISGTHVKAESSQVKSPPTSSSSSGAPSSSRVDPSQTIFHEYQRDSALLSQAEKKSSEGEDDKEGGGGGGGGGGGSGGSGTEGGGESEGEDMWAQALTLNTQIPDHAQNNTEIIAQVGGEATFSCYTHHLSDEMVTWLKRDDDQLLTVGQQVYAAETRFSATHSHHSKAWELWVRDVQLSDAGQYECQLTTHPPVTFVFTLKVTQAEAIVSGPSEVHIEEGSKLALECHVRHAAAPPVYIFWYHNSTMVNYGQSALQVHHRNYTSSLVVTRVQPSDAGTYSCQPHLAIPANVSVHVVTGKKPAAMQHPRNQVGGAASCFASTSHALFLVSFSCLYLTHLLLRHPPAAHPVPK